jgi:hypothetical protein
MDFVLLVLQVAVWLSRVSGGGPSTEDLEYCPRAHMVPCVVGSRRAALTLRGGAARICSC